MGDRQKSARKKHFEKIYRNFDAAIAEGHDCGRYCAPLNGGTPVCCDHEHAIPAASPPEWKVMKKRTDLWSRYRPDPDDSQAVREVAEIEETCVAVVCKGARYCERDNRLLACRAFPFFPYFTKEGEFIGLAYYWSFEDRCWVISNLGKVDQAYVQQFAEAYDKLTDVDEGEFQAFFDESATMRRVFSRWNRPIPLIGLDGEYYKVLPKSGGKVIPATPGEFSKHGPYKSDRAYQEAVREAAALCGPED